MRSFLIAVVMLAAASPAIAVEMPKAFVTALYKTYDNPDADPLGKSARKIFSPSLLALIRADKAPDGEVGKLDYDPICGCQDADGLKLLSVTVKPVSAASVHAISKFRIGATIRTVDLTLIRTPIGWRVDDVNPDGTGSLRSYLGDGKRKR